MDGLIVCNGDINRKFFIKVLKANPKITLIAADGASNILYKYKITPDYIVGDLDSIKPSVLKYFKSRGVKIKKITEQEHTDLEKSIKLALSLKLKHIRIIGYAGKRIDHTINHFSILKRYYKKADIRFIDPEFEIFYTDKSIEFKSRKGGVVSFLGMPKAEGIRTSGLKYALHNEPLEFGVREGALNEAVSDKVRIGIRKGLLIIFKKHYSKV